MNFIAQKGRKEISNKRKIMGKDRKENITVNKVFVLNWQTILWANGVFSKQDIIGNF